MPIRLVTLIFFGLGPWALATPSPEPAPSDCNELLSQFMWQNDEQSRPDSTHLRFLREFGGYDRDQLTRNLLRQYPEIRYLLSEADDSAEVVAFKPYPDSPSLKYSGSFYPEFDRTLLSIWLLQLIVRGTPDAHQQFIAAQSHLPERLRLQPESWKSLHALFAKVLAHDRLERLDGLIAYMVNHDLGKSKEFQRQVAALSPQEDQTGHDQVFLTAMKQTPQLMPGLMNTSPRMRHFIKRSSAANFGAIPQFAQGEAPAIALSGIQNMGANIFEFAFLHSVLDVAGASGAKSFSGSGSMIEPLFQNYLKAHDGLWAVAEKRDLLPNVYWDFFATQAHALGITLDMNQLEDRALGRLLRTTRAATVEEAQTVQKVFSQLMPSVKALLSRELGRSGLDDGWAVMLEYSPALIQGCFTHFKNAQRSNWYEAGLSVALHTMTRIFGQSRKLLKGREGHGMATVDLREFAGQMDKIAGEMTQYDFELSLTTPSLIKIQWSKRPSSGAEDLPRFDFSELPDAKAILVGMGGGSDAIQAGLIGQLMRHNGKNVSAVVSVRVHPGDDKVQIKDAIPIAPDVYQVTANTVAQVGSTGRFLEKAMVRNFLTYLVLDREKGDLKNQLEKIHQVLADDHPYFIGIDSGGDSLTRIEIDSGQGFQATPDRDHQVLRALTTLADQAQRPFYSLIVGPGIDSPAYAKEIFALAEARFHELKVGEAEDLDISERAMVLETAKRWKVDGTDPELFGVTMLGWQAALRGPPDLGWTPIPLPLRAVLHPTNPWLPFARTESSTRGIVVMKGHQHLAAIGAKPIPFGTYSYDKIRDWEWIRNIDHAFRSMGWAPIDDRHLNHVEKLVGTEVVGLSFQLLDGHRSLVFSGRVTGVEPYSEDGRSGTFVIIDTDQGDRIKSLITISSPSLKLYSRP